MDKTNKFVLPSPNFNKNDSEINKVKTPYLTPCGMNLLPREKQPPPMYGPRGATIPPKFLNNLEKHKQSGSSKQSKPNVQQERPSEPKYCDGCEMELQSLEDLKRHKAQHEPCPVDGCKYRGHPNVMDKHVTTFHSSSIPNKVKKLTTPEEIAAWREERKKRFPTLANIQLKEQAREQRQRRGERLGENKNRFGRPEDRKRIQSSKLNPDDGDNSFKENKNRNKRNRRKNSKDHRKGKKQQENKVVTTDGPEKSDGHQKTDSNLTETKEEKKPETQSPKNEPQEKQITIHQTEEKNQPIRPIPKTVQGNEKLNKKLREPDRLTSETKKETLADCKEFKPFKGTRFIKNYKPKKTNSSVKTNALAGLVACYGSDDSSASETSDSESIESCNDDAQKEKTDLQANPEKNSTTALDNFMRPKSPSPSHKPHESELSAKEELTRSTSIVEKETIKSEVEDEDGSDDAPEEFPIEHTSNYEPDHQSPPPVNQSSAVKQTKDSSKLDLIKRKRKYGLDYSKAKLRKQNTMLEKLLEPQIRHERNVLLQCVRFVCQNNFFGIGATQGKTPNP